MWQIIPITNTQQNQTIQTTLNINNKNVILTIDLNFNRIANYWTMNITDTASNNRLLSGVPLLYGANLLGQFEYLQIGEWYIDKVTNTPLDSPDANSLGTDFVLNVGDNT